METLKLARQMINFNKATFDNTHNAMVLFQEQTEKMANSLWEQAGWLPEEGKKTFHEWVETCKKGREEFKKAVDDGYKKVETFFAEASSGDQQ